MGGDLRVIVCGGRDFDDRALIWTTLDSVHEQTPIGYLWHGNARGTDTIAGEWAKYGKRAGPIRNQNMLGQGIHLVIAFPGGRGTADMVRRAKAAGVEVREIAPAPPVTCSKEGTT